MSQVSQLFVKMVLLFFLIQKHVERVFISAAGATLVCAAPPQKCYILSSLCVCFLGDWMVLLETICTHPRTHAHTHTHTCLSLACVAALPERVVQFYKSTI